MVPLKDYYSQLRKYPVAEWLTVIELQAMYSMRRYLVGGLLAKKFFRSLARFSTVRCDRIALL
jgi:hypothetical protein